LTILLILFPEDRSKHHPPENYAMSPSVSQTCLLGIDNGGTVAKAALIGLDGRELGVASARTAILSPHSGWSELDADQLWQRTAEAVRRLIGETAIDPGKIVAVACTGHGNGLYLIDGHGMPVRPAIFSADMRAQSIIDRWTAEGIDRVVRPQTMQALWAGQPGALLSWLQDHEPDSLRRVRWALMCKDFIRYRLTGEAWGEMTDMSGTSLMDIRQGHYAAEVLEAFGIGQWAPILPPLRWSHECCGHVTADASRETGLTEGTPVAGGMFDVDACALASALTDEGKLGMTLGTWGINQYVSKTPVVDGVFMTSRYCVPGDYLILEGSATSASNLEWFVQHWLGTDLPAATVEGPSVYERINQLVARTPPSADGPLFLPFLYGSNVSPQASACLVGLRARHRRGDVLRAVYEGVVFAHRTHWDRLLRVRSAPERIRVSGGAARSDVWVQMIADVFQLPVEVPEGSELGALGAAICGSVAIGCYPDYRSACQAMVRFPRIFSPHPELAATYATKYSRYQQFLEAMEGFWKEY
jgi:L-xylulokinase